MLGLVFALKASSEADTSLPADDHLVETLHMELLTIWRRALRLIPIILATRITLLIPAI